MPDTNVTTATVLAPTAPLPATEEIRYDTAPPERRAEIEEAMKEISIDESTSVLFFGTSAQDAVTGVADEMLDGVRNKDTGAAGEALNEMVTTLRGLPVADLESGKKPGMLQRVFRSATPIARMLQQIGAGFRAEAVASVAHAAPSPRLPSLLTSSTRALPSSPTTLLASSLAQRRVSAARPAHPEGPEAMVGSSLSG